MAEHTELPWTLGNAYGCAKNHAVCAGPFVVARVTESYGDIQPGNRSFDHGKANAAFIVRAVNCHDDLVAALEPFAEVVGEGDEDFADDTPCTVHLGRSIYYALTLGDFRRAIAVLAKARGQ